MSRRSRWSLRGLVLSVLVPLLLLSATVSGWVTYRTLYDIILGGGFEQKLNAISTASAALIDPETHERLAQPRAPVAVAGDPEEPVLWAIDSISGELLAIDPVVGEAEVRGPAPAEGIAALASVPGTGELVGWRSGGELVVFRPGEAEARVAGRLGPRVLDLTFDPEGGGLVVARGDALEGWPWPLAGATRPVWRAETGAVAVAARGEEGRVWALDAEGRLAVVDPGSGAIEAGRALQLAADEVEEETAEGQLEPSARAAPPIRALTSSPFATGLLGIGDRLLHVDPEASEVRRADARRGFRSQSGPEYEEIVRPLRRVREALDVTYLYSQIPVPGDSIAYVVDATPLGPDHSPIGTHEALDSEEESVGVQEVQERALVYSSGIADSEEWGLLKWTYAPIQTPSGSVVGMVGADISVAKIQDRTQLALARVGLVSLLTLLLGGLGAIVISLRLTGPLAAVQEGASRVAAGRRSDPISPPKLRDLASLTTAFNEMTRVLTSSVDDLTEERLRADVDRGVRDLHESLHDGSRDGWIVRNGASFVQIDPGATEGVLLISAVTRGEGESGRQLAVLAQSGVEEGLARDVEGRELRELVERLGTGRELPPLADRIARVWPTDRLPVVVVEVASGRIAVAGEGERAALPERLGAEEVELRDVVSGRLLATARWGR